MPERNRTGAVSVVQQRNLTQSQYEQNLNVPFDMKDNIHLYTKVSIQCY